MVKSLSLHCNTKLHCITVTNMLKLYFFKKIKTRKLRFKIMNAAGEQGISLSKLSKVKADFFADTSDCDFCHTNGFFGVYFSGLAFIAKTFVMQSQFQGEEMNRG